MAITGAAEDVQADHAAPEFIDNGFRARQASFNNPSILKAVTADIYLLMDAIHMFSTGNFRIVKRHCIRKAGIIRTSTQLWLLE